MAIPTPFDDIQCLDSYPLRCLFCRCVCADLLSFEKMESGILELHRQDVPALQFISDSILLFKPQAREKGVALTLTLDIDETTRAAHPGALPILDSDVFSCDRFKLEQVVRNLVSNAIKFSPKNDTVQVLVFYDTQGSFKPPADELITRSGGGPRAKPPTRPHMRARMSYASEVLPSLSEMDVSNRGSSHSGSQSGSHSGTLPRPRPGEGEGGQSGALVVIVKDHGPGISATNQKKLFKSIIQFSPEKTQGGGGSGFGLFISQGIMALHEGRIDVFSEGEVSGGDSGRWVSVCVHVCVCVTAVDEWVRGV